MEMRRANGAFVSAAPIPLPKIRKRLYVDSKVKNVKFFLGPDGDASPEDFAREINKFFADAENSKERSLW